MKSLLICFSVFLSGCQNLAPKRQVTETVSYPFPYETVNSVPQFADGENHFLFYWAIWRSLSDSEKATLNGSEGVLLSQRNISWSVSDCQTGNLVHQDGERVWYLDELKYDSSGSVIPIKEAPRKGYRYFNMMNLNAQHLRGAGPFKGPKKQRGEKMEDWDKRRHTAFLEWQKKSSPRGMKGSIALEAEHRLFSKEALAEIDPWIHPQDYPKLTGVLLERITKYSPSGWPVNFDERAHKPHLFEEPRAWKNPQSLSKNQFRMRLDWDWCNPEEPVKAEVFVPRGEMPPPGPNRPGRTDSGKKTIKVTEIEWQSPFSTSF